MSDVKVQQKQALSRQEAARFIAELAQGLGDDGKVAVQLGNSTLELSVADELRCELEVAVDGDGIELELELKWSTAARASAEPSEEALAPEESEKEAEDSTAEDSTAEDSTAEDLDAEGEPEEESASEASVEADSTEGESDQAAAGSAEAEPQQTESPDQSAEPAPRRRRAAAKADKPAFNGVDTAAVRAWAAANGFSLPPRGRLRNG